MIENDPTKQTIDPLNTQSFSGLELEKSIPRLHTPEAQTLVRDRWERLVTNIHLSASLEQVWQALTEPEALKLWLGVCNGSIQSLHTDWVLDFEDGEFFLGRSIAITSHSHLQYLWRWLGIGQATTVTWQLEATDQGTSITVTEEAINPPWDWQTWNGGGWNGILEQLAAYLRTGLEWRWCWRRMGPYVQVEIPAPVYLAWDRLFHPDSLKYWLLVMHGHIAPEQSLVILMGDASGSINMSVSEVILPGQVPPSFLPSINFSVSRSAWNCSVSGRLWLEPSGWGRSILQVFHYGWEGLPAGLQLAERKILTRYWADTMRRASILFRQPDQPGSPHIGPHNW
jgi:uncharacterized protein YndB with AHSA1/START domain